jgi:branched-chain amino acid transport system substrate-binding protein
MKDAQKLGMKTVFFTNIWAATKTWSKLAGTRPKAAIPSSRGDLRPGRAGQKIIEKQTGASPDDPLHLGFASMLSWPRASGSRRRGRDHGPAIKTALESLRDYDPMA